MIAEPPQATSVRPVAGHNVFIRRAGRVLLNIPTIVFGDDSAQGSCTMIVGPNGAGKSLLVRTLCHLLEPDGGSVSWGKSAPDVARRHRVGLVLQKPVLLRRSALANLTYALRHSGMDRQRSSESALTALQQAGLEQIANVQAHRLSGGEQQRLALVRALLLKPDILFLDEVTANVDPASTLVIEQHVQSAVQDGLSVVMVSHDQGQVRRMGSHIVLLHQGQVLEHASAEAFFERPGNGLSKRWIDGELLV